MNENQKIIVEFVKKAPIHFEDKKKKIPFTDRKSAEEWIKDLVKFDKGLTFSEFSIREVR